MATGGRNSHSCSANVAEERTAKQIAAEAGSSIRAVDSVNAVLKRGSPELVDSMKQGRTPAHVAEAISKLPIEQQSAAINKPRQLRGTLKVPKPVVPDPRDLRIQELEGQVSTLTNELKGAREMVSVLSKIDASPEPLAQAIDEAKVARERADELESLVVSKTQQIAELRQLLAHLQCIAQDKR